ncbi:MAG: winged helix DNA-binding protein [Pirellulaceae bacterium]|nr:winged helix DNA-binding protein [Pirellulaceae bacterium]
MSSKPQIRLSETDQSLLDLIRHQGSASIADLCDSLQVTATAVRQRLTRMVAADLLESVKVKQERGRPLHVYRLTPLGLRTMGENLSDLAEALWAEVTAIPDASVRQTVIEGVLQRLIKKYREQISGTTVTERLTSIATLFRQRRIPFVVENQDSQATLRIVGCPYPRLNDHGDEICRFEQRLVSELLDLPVALNHCQCSSSGGKCCTFSAQVQTELNQIIVKQPKADAVSS